MNYGRWVLFGLVLLALVVIFKPLAYKFHAEKQHSALDIDNFPQKDKTNTVIDTQKVDQHFSQATNLLAYQPKTTEEQTQQQHAIETPEKTYVLQLGSFSKNENAMAMVKNLQAKNYKAYSQKVGDTYRVYVGPILGKKDTDDLKAKLDKQEKSKAVIVDYSPLQELP